MKKGQYFSVDILVAIIIFIFSVSILVNYWQALKGQGSDNDFLYSEALRLSDLLLTPGDYNVSGKSINNYGALTFVNWYNDPDKAVKAGFGTEGIKNKIVYAPSSAILGSNFPSFTHPDLKVYNSAQDPYYKKLKTIFGTNLDFYIVFKLYLSSSLPTNYTIAPIPPSLEKEFGLKLPSNTKNIAKVRRTVYAFFSSGPVKTPQYIGFMEVYVW